MFSRTISLIGQDSYYKLKNSHILVLGVGGVGGYAIEDLIRSGIENITIVDYDKIDITNINRQIIATTENIGKLKIGEFKKRILAINPNVKVTSIKERITEDNIDILFNDKYDFIIDACDTISVKKLLIKKCHDLNINLITVCGMGKRTEPNKIKICDIRDTSYDAIAKILRKYVKDEKITEKVPCVFSSESPTKREVDFIPSMVFVPSVAGIIAAKYVIDNIIK